MRSHRPGSQTTQIECSASSRVVSSSEHTLRALLPSNHLDIHISSNCWPSSPACQSPASRGVTSANHYRSPSCDRLPGNPARGSQLLAVGDHESVRMCIGRVVVETEAAPRGGEVDPAGCPSDHVRRKVHVFAVAQQHSPRYYQFVLPGGGARSFMPARNIQLRSEVLRSAVDRYVLRCDEG